MSKTTSEPNLEAPAQKPKRSKLRWVLRQTRRLVVLLSIGLLIPVIGFALFAWEVNYRGDLAVRQISSDLRDRGILSLYTDAQPKPDEDGNYADESGTSAAHWRAAMAVLPDAGDRPLPVVGHVNMPSMEERQQYHPDMVLAMREAVAENELFFELVQQAREAPQGPFLPKDDLEAKDGSLDQLGNVRAIARWMQMRAILSQIDNDGDSFVSATTAVLDLNHNLQDQPQMIVGLVRVSVDALVRHAIFESGLSNM